MSRERFINSKRDELSWKGKSIGHVEIEVSVRHSNKKISREGNWGLELRTPCLEALADRGIRAAPKECAEKEDQRQTHGQALYIQVTRRWAAIWRVHRTLVKCYGTRRGESIVTKAAAPWMRMLVTFWRESGRGFGTEVSKIELIWATEAEAKYSPFFSQCWHWEERRKME